MRGTVALYVGAGTDTRPLTRLPHIGHFIYVDGQPYSEFPDCEWRSGFARPQFLPQLDQAMSEAGFTLDGATDSGVRAYRGARGRRLVEYHTNTGIPHDVSKLPRRRCSVLIAAGHDPHSAVIEHSCHAHGITLIGFEGTVYTTSSDAYESRESTFSRLGYDDSFRQRFARFEYHTPQGARATGEWAALCELRAQWTR